MRRKNGLSFEIHSFHVYPGTCNVIQGVRFRKRLTSTYISSVVFLKINVIHPSYSIMWNSD